VILVVLAGAAGPARADSAPAAIDGEVVRVDSRWSASGDRIVSETTVRADDGREVVMLQLGGSVDGIGMRVTHMPGVPRVGERVHATYSRAVNRRGVAVNRLETLTKDVVQSARGGAIDPRYVNTRTGDSGAKLYWASGCVFIAYDAAGTSHLDNEVAVMDQVFANWRAAISDCSYLRFQLDGPIEGEQTRYDGTNLIMFRENRWCRPADGDDPEMCYAPAAAALTTLFFVDDEGNQVPSCTPEISLSAEIKDATMYNFQVCGETKKSSPEQDDIDGICTLYPIADDPGTCARVDVGGTGGCCSVAPGRRAAPRGQWWGALLLATLALAATAFARSRGSRAASSTGPSRSRRP